MEILAPCGGKDSLPAALNSGADAVYLGIRSFSARKNAKNFDSAELAEAARLCRISGVKLYVTLNTLIFDDEAEALAEAARTVEKAGADGVIVQDLGAIGTIKRAAPSLRLHGSTQMTVTSPAGAEFARKNGFSRVVLAREMSLREIEDVVKNVDIETEVFVHGALCVCVSGQCLMSAFYGGRSGNRGLCAQPCRLGFSCGNRQSVLSLKDLSLIPRLKELESLGVTSAKIEGRMKRPEYVAAAVTACKASLRSEAPDMDTLRAVFSRSGFTSGYLAGDLRGMQGTRTAEDVTAAPAVLSKLRKLYEKPFKRRKLDISAFIAENSPVSAKIRCGGLEFEYISDIFPEKARERGITGTQVAERLAKMGGTVFEAGELAADVGEGLMLSAAAVNELRRGIISRTEELLSKGKERND